MLINQTQICDSQQSAFHTNKGRLAAVCGQCIAQLCLQPLQVASSNELSSLSLFLLQLPGGCQAGLLAGDSGCMLHVAAVHRLKTAAGA